MRANSDSKSFTIHTSDAHRMKIVKKAMIGCSQHDWHMKNEESCTNLHALKLSTNKTSSEVTAGLVKNYS